MLDIKEITAAFPEISDITSLAASSGQKDVFKAKHEGEYVVLKLVKKALADDTRTERELAAMAKVASAYVPKVVSTGKTVLGGNERYYIIEQFINGDTYRSLLQRHPKQSLEWVFKMTDILLSACNDFATVKIVHRDLKPENLIVDTSGKLWVIDFGIARHLDLLSITPDGAFGIGTLGYAAPEQFQNIKAEIDVRTDLFAVGIMLYESLSGSHPFLRGAIDGRAILRKMESTDLPILSIPGDTDDEFAKFIAALVQRFPSRRPQTATEAITWFKAISKT